MKMELRKLLSLVLAMVLVVGLCPTAGLAEEVASPTSITQEEGGAPQALPLEASETSLATDSALATDSSLASASSLSSLSGPELAVYLGTLTGPALQEAFAQMTKDQFDSLDVTTLNGEVLYVYLLTTYAADQSAFCTAFKGLTEQQYNSLLDIADEAVFDQWLALVAEAPFNLDTNFTGSVGGLLGSTTVSSRQKLAKSLLAAPAYTDPPSTTPVSSDALITSKTATPNVDGTYNITLTAYTQSNVVSTPTPCDIVLVLDRSLSMNDNITSYTYNPENSPRTNTQYFINVSGLYQTVQYKNGSGNRYWYYGSPEIRVEPAANGTGGDTNSNGIPEYQFYSRSSSPQTKLNALKTAANNFVDTVNTKSPSSRIDVVTYSSGSNNLTNGFLLVSSNATSLKNTINGITVDYTTHTDLGMQEAKAAFDRDTPPAGTRSKVVILFTDGVPTQNSGTFDETVANSAISTANTLKSSSYKATIYTIGFFSGTERSDARVDRFMSYVSSNYKARTTPLTVATTGVTADYSKYYIYTNDASSLNDIFVAIGNELGATISDAIVKDVITRQFELTAASIAAITAAGGTVSTDSYGRQVITWPHTFTPVTVTNGNPDTSQNGYFSFTITVQRKAAYIGGNTAYSNYDDSGVYAADSTLLETFDRPTLNAPVLYDGFVSSTQNIYVGSSVTIASLFSEATYRINGVEYPIDGVYNKYVSIAYTLKQGSTTMGTYTIPAGSTTGTWVGQNGYGTTFAPTDTASYDVNVSITPIYNGASPSVGTVAVNKTLPGAITINVYKPVITMRNLAVYLTNTPALTDAVVSVEWKNGSTLADTNAMGAYPALSYTFSTAFPSYPTADATQVNVATVTRTDISYTIPAGQRTIVNASGASNTTPHFTVYVLKPTVNCFDSTMFLGDNPVVWSTYLATFTKSWMAVPAGATLSGGSTEPTLSYAIDLTPPLNPLGATSTQFAPVAGGDYNFKIAVSVGSNAITQYTTINNPVAGQTDHHFTVHVLTGQVTITKAGGQSGESYIFTLTGPGGISVKAVVQGNTSTVIKGLPKGTYTVTEDTKWSWRYDATPTISWTGNDATLGDTLTDTAIACGVTNNHRVPFWLSGENYVKNLFSAYGG